MEKQYMALASNFNTIELLTLFNAVKEYEPMQAEVASTEFLKEVLEKAIYPSKR